MAGKKGLELVWYGSTARAYSAFFGEWKKITHVYSQVYGKGGKSYNTGRMSIAVRQLADAGYLKAAKDHSTTWRLYTSTLKPVFDEAQAKGVSFSESERAFIETFLGCAASKPVGAASTALVSFDRSTFVPGIAQARGALSALCNLALVYLFYEHLQGRKLDAYVSALKSVLRGEQGAASTGNVFADGAGKLAFDARSQIKSGIPLEEILVFKLAKYLYPEGAQSEFSWLSQESI